MSTQLPLLKKSILYPGDASNENTDDINFQHRINLIYARNYRPSNDMIIIIKSLRHIGR